MAERHLAYRFLSQADALALRYGPDAGPPPRPRNDQIALSAAASVIHGYPGPLPPNMLETLIAAAQSAATGSSLQTWSIVAVTNPVKKATLARLANNRKHIEQCPLFLVWLADISRHQRPGSRTAERVLLEAMPCLETFLVAAIDAALAPQMPWRRQSRWA